MKTTRTVATAKTLAARNIIIAVNLTDRQIQTDLRCNKKSERDWGFMNVFWSEHNGYLFRTTVADFAEAATAIRNWMQSRGYSENLKRPASALSEQALFPRVYAWHRSNKEQASFNKVCKKAKAKTIDDNQIKALFPKRSVRIPF